MTHFTDLSSCRYHRGLLDTDSWDCPLLAIGWLEVGDDFLLGVCPSEFLNQIEFLREAIRSTFPAFTFRGLHECSFCGPDVDAYLSDSHINLIVPGDGCVYAAPGRIDHYIDQHGYCPPNEFLDAVSACPDPRSDEYLAALVIANGGISSPLHK